MHPFIFTTQFFSLPAYGLMVAAGYLAGIWFVFRRAGAAGLQKEALSDLVFYTVIGGMLGAKLFYAATYWDEFGAGAGARLAYLLRTFRYGFVFYGGLLGGGAAFLLSARRLRLPVLRAADLFSPALALGHAFGRVGCFLAGCCHGAPAGRWPGVTFTDPACEVSPALLGIPLHPVQLYEAAGNAAIFFLLQGALARTLAGKARPGAVTALYCALYALLRGLLEFLRGDDRGFRLLGLSPAQLLSLPLACAAAWFFFGLRSSNEKK